MTVTADTLKAIIDEVFAAVEAAIPGKIFLKIALEALHSIAISLIPTILGALARKNVVQ